MKKHSIPNDILRSAFDAFLSGKGGDSPAHAAAHQNLLSLIEDGLLPLVEARKMLVDPDTVLAVVEKVRQDIEAEDQRKVDQNSRIKQELLERIHANSERTLNEQDAMRTEFRRLFDELHGHVNDVHAATQANRQTAEDIRAATREIKEVIPKIAVDSAAAAKAAGWKAGIVTALIVSPIAVITSYLGNKFTNVADRVLVPPTEEHEVIKASLPVSAPPPQPDPVPVVLGPKGPSCPATGQTMLELLQGGHKVLLPTSQGMASVCLRPNAPLVCKPQPFSR